MDKRRAIQIMTKAAQLYKEHLEDQKVLFLYGLPKEVNKQLQESNKILSSVQGYEVVFHRYNFLHLTGVRLNKKKVDNPNKEKQKKARALLLNLTKSLDGDE
jgi:adenine C2-methylase RlmN of 23S rRNA A2503 and tRNA A37